MIEVRCTQILRGAAQVFSQKGFYQATTKEIAKAAPVSEGTIYNYFKNKHDLLVDMLNLLGTDVFKGMALGNPAKNSYDRKLKTLAVLNDEPCSSIMVAQHREIKVSLAIWLASRLAAWFLRVVTGRGDANRRLRSDADQAGQ
jgi:AcrR family transcriptional regulator